MNHLRRTKIVVTLGPSLDDPETLRRVIVAGAEDPAVPRHVGFDAAPTVEDAIRMAEATHGRDCSIVCVN